MENLKIRAMLSSGLKEIGPEHEWLNGMELSSYSDFLKF